MAPHKEVISRISYSPGGELLATCSADATARIWSASDGAEKNTLQGHKAGISDIAWHPQQPCVATASDDLCARVWDAEAGKCLRELRGHSHFLYCCQFSTYGNVLITGALDEAVRLWEVRSGQCIHTIPAHCDPVTAVDCCRDGTVIASASTDGLCRLWDLRTGKLLRTLLLPDASRPFTSVQFSPTGRFLCAVDDADGFNVWDWRKESGTVVRQFKGHSGCVEAQFFQDKHALSISRDSYFDVWNLESSKAQDGSLFQATDSEVRSWMGAVLKKVTGGDPPASAPAEEALPAHGGQIQALSVHQKTNQVALVHCASSEDQRISVMSLPELQL